MIKHWMMGMALLASLAQSAEYEIRMLEFSDDGTALMLFDPPFLKIEPGDTVTFIPTHKSHYVETTLVPEGAVGFKSKFNQKISVKLEAEGVYLYVCPPYQIMNMVGMIQVGRALNLREVKATLPKLTEKARRNQERLETYAKQIDLEGIPEIVKAMTPHEIVIMPSADLPKPQIMRVFRGDDLPSE